MAEEVKKEVEAEAENYVYGYTVKYAATGGVDIKPLEKDGKDSIPVEACADDVEKLARQYAENKQFKLMQAAVVTVLRDSGLFNLLVDISKKVDKMAAEAEAETKVEVE